jgi:hypothetical protein
LNLDHIHQHSPSPLRHTPVQAAPPSTLANPILYAKRCGLRYVSGAVGYATLGIRYYLLKRAKIRIWQEPRSMPIDPDHPIIQAPWEYEVIEFCYRKFDDSEAFVDLVFRKGAETRRLRFYSPRDIRITGNGFPSASGLEILDVCSRQLDGVGVRVSNYEGGSGSPEFWARIVKEITS